MGHRTATSAQPPSPPGSAHGTPAVYACSAPGPDQRLPGGRGHADRRAHTQQHGPGEGTLPPGQPPSGNPRKNAEWAGEARGTEAAPKRDPKQRGAPPRAAAAPPSPPPGPREQRAAPARRRHRPPYLTETAAEPPPPPAGAAQAKDAGTALPSGAAPGCAGSRATCWDS